MKLVGAWWKEGFPQYVIAFFGDLPQVVHLVRVFLLWLHEHNLEYSCSGFMNIIHGVYGDFCHVVQRI